MSKDIGQKRKERAKKSRAKVLRRRTAIRAKAKKERLDALEQRKLDKIANRVEGKTAINRSPEEQHELVQHNLAILEALKQEQEQKPGDKMGLKASADVTFTPNPAPIGEISILE